MTTCRQISSRISFWSRLGPFLPLLSFCFFVHSAVAQTTQTVLFAPQNHKIQTSDPTLAAQLESSGARLIADYGSYRLYESAQLPSTLAADSRAELRDHYNTIFLHAGHLDTRQAEVKALRKLRGEFAGRRLHLVQFAGPVQAHWRNDLLAAGAQIVSYIPENTYLIYGDAACLAQVQSIAATAPHVQWEGNYLDDYKIHPKARLVDELGNPRAIGTDLFDIQLVADDSANAATLQLLDRLKLEPFQRQTRVLDYLDLVVRLNPKDLALIATQPEVVSILPFYPREKVCERQDQIIAGNLTGNLPSGPGYLAWLASLGFTQAQFTNFIVDVSDSGVDNGTTSPGHFGLYTGGDPASASRVKYNRLEGSPNSGSTLQGCDGHGNLNAHIIAGYDAFDGFPFADTNGFHYGLGVCPFVGVGSSVIFDPGYTFPNFTNLQSDAYANGARVSNNSFGASKSAGVYDAEAQVYDALVRDAQPTGSSHPTTGNQGMVIVFAAGNDGPGVQTIDSPGSAKNVITVGAAENVQAFGGADGSGITDDEADSANDLVYFSSRGPCADGRAKPDLVAPGTHVSGGVFQALFDLTNYPDGLAGACFSGSGVSGGPSSAYWPNGQQFYTASTGTSHSTPCVAGGCALVLQYFYNQFTNLPSPAMTKAFLVNSARYMNGVYANDTLPSGSQGMGEMNLGTAFDGAPRILRDQLPGDVFTNSGQSRTFLATVANTNSPLRVTLAWTDAPGSLSGNAYNNNLDLTVVAGGNTYKGNVFSGALSTTGGSYDVKNNLESVFLPPGVSGTVTITVGATSINSIGVPNGSNALKQDFALVAYNANLIPIPNVTNGTIGLVAESCTPTNGSIDPGETVTVNFPLQNTGTGDTTNLVATLLTNSTVFSPSGPQTYGVIPAGGAPVSRQFTFMAGGFCGGTLNATFQVQDGASAPSNINFTIPLGKLVSYTAFSQNFDGVTAPALPAGWTTTNSGSENKWVTSTSSKDSSPNSAFVNDAASTGLSELVTPAISILSSNAQLTFRNSYNLQTGGVFGDDGGVLEIQLGNGAFSDIVTAGGSFVTNGYNRTISTTRGNALGGRNAWSGSSGGFLTTIVNLPAAAAGQIVHLKWRCGTDTSGNSVGWFIDTISLSDFMYVCCADTADLLVTQTASPNPVAVGSNLNFNISVTNLGPITASNVTVSDTAPLGTYILTASPGFFTNLSTVYWNVGDIAAGAQTNLTLTVVPVSSGLIANTASAASTTYDFYLTNNTATATDTAYTPAVITLEPTNDTVVPVGAGASFLVAATGAPPIAYQWYFGATKLVGQTNATLNLLNLQTNQTGAYTAVVANVVTVVTSAVANLTVVAPAVITNQPAAQTFVAVGTNASLHVGVSGTAPIAYQWYFGGVALDGQTNYLLNLVNLQTNQSGAYTVVVTNLFANITSAVASVTVLNPVIITSGPSNQIVPLGTNVSFQVQVSGDAPIGYQWYFNSTNLLIGQTNWTLTLTNVATNQAGLYEAVVHNPVTVVTSTAANLTVVVPVTITNEPAAQSTVAVGANVSLVLGVSGTPPIGYQWYFGGALLAEQTNSVLSLTNLQTDQSGGYTVTATNLFAAATSTVANVSVLQPVAITNQPSDLAVGFGSNATFSVLASGDAPLTYQWYFATNNLPGQTNFSLSLANVSTNQAGPYFVTVQNPVSVATSAVASLTVILPVAITNQPVAQTIVASGANAFFAVGASGTPPLGYQWFFGGLILVGQTNSVLSLTNLQAWQSGVYTVVATDLFFAATSAVANLAVLAPVVITNQPSDQIVAVGSNATFRAQVTGDGPLTYQWYFDETNALAQTNDTLTLTNIATNQTGPYFVIVQNPVTVVTSAVATLTVVTPPIFLSEPFNQIVLVGTNVTFQSAASGLFLSYQWSFNGTNLSGATTNQLVVTNVLPAQAGSYTITVTNVAGQIAAAAQLTTLLPPLNLTATGGAIIISLPSQPGLNYTLQYKDNLSDAVWISVPDPVPGTGETITLQDPAPSLSGRFYRVICN